MINNNDVDPDMDDGEQDFDISFGYSIPFIWFICFYCLWRSQERYYRGLERREGGDEVLVAEFIRSEIP